MSNLSLKSAFKDDKFNLKMVVILFVLVDFSLIGAITLQVLFYLVLYQMSLIIGLLYGLRGQGKFRQVMVNLESIARNQKLSTDEREHQLVMGVHHHMLELGYIYEQRNRSYGLFKKKRNGQGKKNPPGNKKKTKKLGGKKKMTLLIWDETVWKQFGYSMVAIWELFLPVVALFLSELDFHWVIIAFLGGVWGVIGLFVWFYLHYIFKLPIPEIPGADTDAILAAKKEALKAEIANLEAL